jgi:nitrite reductase/ring-hydroxylating ferredoxin subunit
LKLVGRIKRSEVDGGALVRVAYPPFDVLVAKVGGDYCAIEDACNHAGASLSEGDIRGGCVLCPMHGYKFDMKTGVLVSPRGLCDDQRAFVVKVDGDELELWDPFEVEIRTGPAR